MTSESPVKFEIGTVLCIDRVGCSALELRFWDPRFEKIVADSAPKESVSTAK
jgi:hypothetical protein